LTFAEELFDTGRFLSIGGSTTGADVDETVDVRARLSSSSIRFFNGA
jgi:hypothetical protein